LTYDSAEMQSTNNDALQMVKGHFCNIQHRLYLFIDDTIKMSVTYKNSVIKLLQHTKLLLLL